MLGEKQGQRDDQNEDDELEEVKYKDEFKKNPDEIKN
jgi:hypothetical protein